MDKRILIPTDFSENALNAIRYALQLYAKQRCEFYFLNIFHPESFTTKNLFIPEPGSMEYEAAKMASEKEFTNLLNTLELDHKNNKHSYHTISVFDLLSEAMQDIVRKNDIDLIVMGTQGVTGTLGVIFGSNTVMAMEKIRECPILAIPGGYPYNPPGEIVFPTDFKDAYKRKQLGYLLEIASMHGSAIRVLHVSRDKALNTKEKESKKLLDEILANVAHSFHTLTEKDVARALASFVESRNSDMVAFINHKHFFFGNVFSRPLVKEIGYEATIPILALH